jgi:hypothetical protein
MDMVENLVLLNPAKKVGKRRLNQNSSILLSTTLLESEAGHAKETPKTKRKRLDRLRKRKKREDEAVRQENITVMLLSPKRITVRVCVILMTGFTT